MKKLFILATLFCVLFQADAKTKKKKRKKKAKTTITTKTTTKTTTTAKPGTLVVSFISIGSGIDFKSVPVFEQALKDYNSKQQCGIIYETKTWGREGERDFCIHAPKQECLNGFAAELRTKFKENTRILIKENAQCRK